MWHYLTHISCMWKCIEKYWIYCLFVLSNQVWSKLLYKILDLNANTDFRCRLQFSLSQLRSEQLTFLNIPWINKSEGVERLQKCRVFNCCIFSWTRRWRKINKCTILLWNNEMKKIKHKKDMYIKMVLKLNASIQGVSSITI